MSKAVVFVNGRLRGVADAATETAEHYNALIIQNKNIKFVGNESDEAVQLAKQNGAEVVDLENQLLVPGIIDSHTHLLMFGHSLQKLDLGQCKSLEEIRQNISNYAKEFPKLPRILCRGWLQSSTNGVALSSMLDDLDPRPIYIDSLDLHSSWCNTAALDELPIEEIKASCGRHISLDSHGNPTGLLAETAVTAYVWPHLARCSTPQENQDALELAIKAYTEAGYTGLIDMAMDSNAWEALESYKKTRGLPLHVAAHWFIAYEQDTQKLMQQVDEAISMHQKWHPSKSPDFCIVGIKLMCDGVVDGCTAALSYPYGYGEDLEFVKPIWSEDSMQQVVRRAAGVGLQCAIHAIGDAAVNQAIESIASANNPSGRHRIEHLELASQDDAKRLGSLGITASVQPVHSDPAILRGYEKLITNEAWEGVFPYQECAAGGAHIAIGTDAPTAKHLPLPNFYNATTRKSALEPELDLYTNPKSALTLAQTLTAATADAAYSRFAETWTGTLKEGMQADFAVIDAPELMPETLLQAKVRQTWFKGQRTFMC